MNATKGMRAVVIKERWSGHGEGGTLVEVRITNRPRPEDTYNSTENDVKQAELDAEYINRALEYYDNHHG